MITNIESVRRLTEAVEMAGVVISNVGTVGTVGTAPQFLTQARAYNKVGNKETPAVHKRAEKRN